MTLPTTVTRTFSGYAAAWALDLGGDIIVRGAFHDFLAGWKSGREHTVALVDTHDRSSVFKVMGRMVEAEEDSTGLFATFEVVDDDDGARLLARLAADAVSGLSIGYEVPPGGARAPTPAERVRWPGVERVLTRITLGEVSCVQAPMNPAARVTAVGKARDDHAFARAARVDAATAKGDRGRAAFLAALAGDGGVLAPEDRRRLALEDRYRRLVVSGLVTRAQFN